MDLRELQQQVNAISGDQSWRAVLRTFGDCIAELHAAVSRVLEAYRQDSSFQGWQTLKSARGWVNDLHRHHRAPQGGLFTVGVEADANAVDPRENVFHTLPQVEHFSEWGQEVIQALHRPPSTRR